MLAVLGAMKQEIATLRKQMAVEETRAPGGCLIYKGKYGGKDVLLVQTGVGKERAERAAEAVLERYPLEAMVSLGFAGALDEGLKIGDVILYSTLYFANEVVSKEGDACHSDADLLLKGATAAKNESFRLFQGGGVTVPRVVTNPESKQSLGKAYSAKAVDMESYWVARAAQAKGVPFLAVRVISDTAGQRLPPFERLMDSQGWQMKRALPYFLMHPWQVAKLLRLRRNVHLAGESLAFFMDSFVAEL